MASSMSMHPLIRSRAAACRTRIPSSSRRVEACALADLGNLVTVVATFVGLMLAATGASASAHATAQRYLDAIAAGNRAEICHLLSPSARRELLEESQQRTCRDAVRDFPRALGRVPIVAVHVHGHLADVTVGDARYSDSGDDHFRMSHASGRWLILDV